MKQNYIADPFKPYHNQQHTLPISPQNFDPLDKSREYPSQKKPIFPTTNPNKPKTLFEALSEDENPSGKGEDAVQEGDLKKMLAKEMSSQLEGIKNEILEGFTALLQGTLNPSKITNKDILDMKRQTISNKNKFEEIQGQIGHLNQQYDDINSSYVQELQSMKSTNSFSIQPRGDYSGFEEDIQSQIETQLQSFKDELLNEVHSSLNMKDKSRREEEVAAVDELNHIKYTFEGKLKQDFGVINERIRKAEENLNDIMKKKRDYMDGIRAESLASIEGQNRGISQGINYATNYVKTKFDHAQTKVSTNAEINRRADSYRAEVDSLRKAIMLNHDDIEETNTSMHRKLDSLDATIKRQFFDLQNSSRRGENQGQRQDFVERRIQKLSGDSDGYHNAIQQLRTQLEEVTRAHRQLQGQSSTPATQEIIGRLEAKISGLQNQIREIEGQIRRQQQRHSQPQIFVEQPSKMSSPTARSSRGFKDLSVLDVSQGAVSDDNSMQWFSPKSHRADYKSPFETEIFGHRERKSYGHQPQSNEEKLKLPDYNGYNGDPKVKSIIDEFNQKKRQVPMPTPMEKKNLNERPRQLEPVNELTSFKDPRRSHYIPSSVSSKTHRDLQEINTSPVRNQKASKYFETDGDMSMSKTARSKTEVDVAPRPQIIGRKGTMDATNAKKIKHAKIIAQINYFIYGTVSDIFNEEEDSEICCNLDDDGYIFDEDGDVVLDNRGNKVKLTPEQIEKFNNSNMIE